MLAGFAVNSVGGYSIGADPIVTAIAVLSHLENKPLPAFIIRKEQKGHGTRKMIEGNFRAGDRVALFDDVITSGASIITGARQVEAQGGKVDVIMAVLDRQEGGREAIEAHGFRFHVDFYQKRFAVTFFKNEGMFSGRVKSERVGSIESYSEPG